MLRFLRLRNAAINTIVTVSIVLRVAQSLQASPAVRVHRALLHTGGGDSVAVKSKNLVSVEDALEAYMLSQSDNCKTSEKIVFVDGSFYHKGNRNGRSEFEAGPRLPGARYMDMLDVSTSKELYPNLNPKGIWAMLPPKNLFAAFMDAFDIKNSDRVIIYGREGSIFTPRTWFLFKTMGHENVQLMQGSLEAWVETGGPVEAEPTSVVRAEELLGASVKPTRYKQVQDPLNVMDMRQMQEFVEKKDGIIIDPRGSSFAKGYIPGAINLPYKEFVEPDNQLKLKSPEKLLELFEGAGIDIQSDKPIVCSCGSGVSVCHVYLALEECGRKGSTQIYDGSWNEWKKYEENPKVVA